MNSQKPLGYKVGNVLVLTLDKAKKFKELQGIKEPIIPLFAGPVQLNDELLAKIEEFENDIASLCAKLADLKDSINCD